MNRFFIRSDLSFAERASAWLRLFLILFGLQSIAALFPGAMPAQEFLEPAMVEIPEGPFLYGAGEAEVEAFALVNQRPNAAVIRLATYSIGRYEVSNAEYACFIRDGGYQNRDNWSEAGWSYKEEFQWSEPYRWRDRDYNEPGKENYPAAAISWYEAQAYARWLSRKTGKAYRLPTEAEWEKAARGTDGRVFPWGNDWNETACNWLGDSDGDRLPDTGIDGFVRTAPVDAFENSPSPFGCYTMSGNVLEWCENAWDEREGEKSRYRVYRGGCFLSSEPRLLRCAWRGGNYPQLGHAYWGIIGFRLAQGGEPETSTPNVEGVSNPE